LESGVTALDVADGDGGRGHEGHGAAGFASNGRTRKIIHLTRICAKFIPQWLIDMARNFTFRKGSSRCIKLLAAWLLQRAAPYNCRLPQQN
ncbi:hypothetical protein, partial [Burkholderia cenocepacia]|uniref:hypothetical protein n=1 Tax=Burkholderia cenocepacia TaxID=95486 RepID=UPI001C0C2DC9